MNEEEIDVLNENDTSEEVVENQVQETKTYSEEEVEAIRQEIHENNQKAWDKRWGQEKSKMEREYAQKDQLINLLKEQTGKENMADLLDYSYAQYGMERPNTRTQEEDEILGKHDAKVILELDDETIKEEADRLAKIEKRTAREQAQFVELNNFIVNKTEQEKRNKEIQEIGIGQDVYDSQEFKDLLNKFDKNTSLKEVYEIYQKINNAPKKEKPFSVGSLKNTKESGSGVKDYYTFEESKQFTKADFDNNPELWEAVQRSMPKWSKKK